MSWSWASARARGSTAGLGGRPGTVRTYALGLTGAAFALLDMVATSGGTSCGATPACDIGTGSGLADVLATIRDEVTVSTTRTETRTIVHPEDCQWSLPPVGDGGSVDRRRLNVVLDSPSGETALVRVADEATCGAFTNAWYFDDRTSTKRVVACPATCDALARDTGARAVLELGCPTREFP